MKESNRTLTQTMHTLRDQPRRLLHSAHTLLSQTRRSAQQHTPAAMKRFQQEPRASMLSAVFLLLTAALFRPAALAAQEYGLVLSGGGGKGAYEVGVWKALTEYGVAQKVTEFSGTSVGGLNAALFACTTCSKAEEIWRNLVPLHLTDNDGSLAEQLISQKGLLQIIDTVPLQNIRGKAWPRVTVTALKKRALISKFILKKKPASEAVHFVLNRETDITEMQRELLATAAFPVVCQPVKLKDGSEYTDGGEESAGGDNTPVAPVAANRSVRTIFVVYLNDLSRLTRRVRQIDYPGIDLIEIIPSIDLGSLTEGTVNFTAERISMLINRGYEDACAVLQEKGFKPVSSYWYSITPAAPVKPQTSDIPAAQTF